MTESPFLIHLTTSDGLYGIINEGRIRANGPYGTATRFVSFTNLNWDAKSIQRYRRRWFGIVFDQAWLTSNYNVNRVWYVEEDSDLYPEVAKIDAIAPFVSRVSGSESDKPHYWTWEREWRSLSDVEFEIDDVVAFVAPLWQIKLVSSHVRGVYDLPRLSSSCPRVVAIDDAIRSASE